MSKTSVGAVAMFIMFSSCEPAERLEYECTDRCFSPDDLRWTSPDVLVRGPGLWRFFDDFGATITANCRTDAGTSFGNLTPLWERTIISRGSENSWLEPTEGDQAALDVMNGTVALSWGGELWVLDAETGSPQHIVSRVGRLPDNEWIRNVDAPGTAVLVHGGNWAWINALGPALVDLRSFDVFRGYSAPVTSSSPTSWSGISPAVADDGTLFWLGHGGTLHALQTDGVTRWEVSGKAGVPLVADDVVLLRQGPPEALDARTGQSVWKLADADEIVLADDAKVGALIPVRHAVQNSSNFVALHRVSDGVITRTIGQDGDGGIGFYPTSGAMSEGRLYLYSRSAQQLAAFDVETGRKQWTRSDKLRSPPVISPDGRLFLAGENCSVTVVNGDGETMARFVTLGEPTQLMKLRGNVLYVLTDVGVLGGDPDNMQDWLYPGSPRAPLVNGVKPRPQDYGCSDGLACWVIRPEQGAIAKLYAFRVN